MNILLIGSGGREHAIADKLSQSKHNGQLFIMPGNAGTAQHGINVPINPLDFAIVGKFCIDNEIELIIVGPEEPLVKGIRDHFQADNRLKIIALIGPGSDGAIIEGSKDWSKAFMQRHQIPTAASMTFQFQNVHDGVDYIKMQSLPIVLKADGLAAGKGVIICETHDEAIREFESMIKEQKFGNASSKVVVESFLKGIELSVFVLSDGKNYIILPEAKDYKRIGENETGLNTGGMGAVSPVPFADPTFMQKVEERIIKPTINGLQQEKIDYKGFIFIGLMNVDGEPFVIEYNCRMGDPESEVVFPRIENDLVELFMACHKGELNQISMQMSKQAAATVMLVSGGYPESYEKDKDIEGIDLVKDTRIYHAGTRVSREGVLKTNGGRVIALTSMADTIQNAVQKSLKAANQIEFEGKYYRRDIGFEFNEPAKA